MTKIFKNNQKFFSTQKEIEEALEESCDQLPKDEQDECRSFIKMYAPQIIEYLLGELTPDDVCKEIGQCAETFKVFLN